MISKIINERLRLTGFIILLGVLFLSGSKNKKVQLSKNILTVNEVIEASLKRFHDFELLENEEKDAINNYKLKAMDELDNTCFLFFDTNTNLLTEIHFPNPIDENEIIKTKFSNWKKINNLVLPYHVEINQNGKIYIFEYTELILNSPEFKYKNVIT
ncbi:MAG: hypothetical protein CVU00_11445 [Bacteroidetes bacterium HGW-Bacteroidetes-17]|jgi:hypothetical protein|nr:MAG: hypothetical protein CVU00_11445 [Bacteroidetes bacterium HGW-Bacteroidetes-17]